MLAFPYGPIPFVGLFILIAFDQLISFVKAGKSCFKIVRDAFSFINICAVISALVFILYFMCNSTGSHIGSYVPLSEYGYERIITLILFYIFEFGLYSILTYKENKHNSLWWIANISLIIIPLIRLGYGRDFCMNASIPALFVIMLALMQVMVTDHKYAVRQWLLTVCVTIAAMSAVLGVGEKILIMAYTRQFPIVADDCYSYCERMPDQKEYDPFNYLVPDYNDKMFYKYLAK